jgi:hypothetical protein
MPQDDLGWPKTKKVKTIGLLPDFVANALVSLILKTRPSIGA